MRKKKNSVSGSDAVESFALFVIGSVPNGGWDDFNGDFKTQQLALDYLGVIDVEYDHAQVVNLQTFEVVWTGHL